MDKRYAVLIDADNISDKYIKLILDEISNYGVATYKRIYGDWTKSGLNNWKSVLLEHSVTPIQQYGYTIGKNSTDSAMIIDAMDILYSGNVEGFCLVTSDSDFTRLASRLRESGMDVIGMGETKTPKPFISACNMFKYLDILAKENQTQEPEPKDVMNNVKALKKAIRALVEDNSDEDEWMFIGDLGNLILKRYPDFDVRNFGFKKFTPFIKSLGIFEIKEEKVRGKKNSLIYIREKQA